MNVIEQIIDVSGDGGVKKTILKEGIGTDTPSNGCTVSVHFTGMCADGTEIGSSVGGQPFEFRLGKGVVIKGFDLGIGSMKLGEKCKLICAPNYAFGEAGTAPNVPPNSTLIFEVELLGWKEEDISPNRDGSIERVVVTRGEKRRTPNEGSFVKVHIIGKYEENVFEDRNVEFDLGEGSDVGIVEGVEIAIKHMSVGDVHRCKFKSEYAFGAKGNEQFKIPPYATVEYTIKLNECEKVMDDWRYMKEERFEQAKIFKEKGTKYFKKENYPLAIKMYKKCVDILTDENNDDESNKIRVAAYNNQTLCYQKMNDQFEGRNACNEVLKLEPNNIKALYRRGQCNLTTSEYKEALLDFQKVVELDPSNKAAQNQIQICRQKIKETNDKEKLIYANMFTKLAVADKEDIPTETDVLSECGEWSDEVDRAFERDNNIVMI